MGKAGATVIGARQFLVAYNVYLNSGDVSIAKKIGKAVRHSSGGLRYVKGLGMLVDGKAQVSMNLTDFKGTPVHRVVEMIRREAARYGASITHSELIGLIPQQALIDAAVWYLQLDGFSDDQVLEYKMNAELAAQNGGQAESVRFLESLADGSPTPGGGSASAYSGAMAAALVAMVGRVTLGKKKYADVEAEMQTVIEKADALRLKLEEAVRQDAASFEGIMAAFRLPKETEAEQDARKEAVQHATRHAAEVPLMAASLAVSVLELARIAAEKGNVNAVSDAGSAAALAKACLTGAGMNVRINLTSLEDQAAVQKMLTELEALQQQAETHLAAISRAVESRGGISGAGL